MRAARLDRERCHCHCDMRLQHCCIMPAHVIRWRSNRNGAGDIGCSAHVLPTTINQQKCIPQKTGIGFRHRPVMGQGPMRPKCSNRSKTVPTKRRIQFAKPDNSSATESSSRSPDDMCASSHDKNRIRATASFLCASRVQDCSACDLIARGCAIGLTPGQIAIFRNSNIWACRAVK
jgi:hypothetical protein